jgi:hypothetical protein
MLAFFDNSKVMTIFPPTAPHESSRIQCMLARKILTTGRTRLCECGGIPRPPGAVPLKLIPAFTNQNWASRIPRPPGAVPLKPLRCGLRRRRGPGIPRPPGAVPLKHLSNGGSPGVDAVFRAPPVRSH